MCPLSTKSYPLNPLFFMKFTIVVMICRISQCQWDPLHVKGVSHTIMTFQATSNPQLQLTPVVKGFFLIFALQSYRLLIFTRSTFPLEINIIIPLNSRSLRMFLFFLKLLNVFKIFFVVQLKHKLMCNIIFNFLFTINPSQIEEISETDKW